MQFSPQIRTTLPQFVQVIIWRSNVTDMYRPLIFEHACWTHRCTKVLRGLKLGREQTKFNLAFENSTLVYVSNRPGLRQSLDRIAGNEISIQLQSVCNFCQDFGPDNFKIFVSHVQFLELIFEKIKLKPGLG